MIVVYAWSWAMGTTSFGPSAATDTAGNQYMEAVTRSTPNCGGGMGAVALYIAPIITSASPHTITIVPGGTGNQEIGVLAAEYSGSSQVLDQTAGKVTASGPSPYTFDSGTVTISTTKELLVSVASACVFTPNPIGWAEAQGFTLLGEETDQNTHSAGRAADRLVTMSGTYMDAWTITYTGGNSDQGLGVVATFR
jgi:hypothetical protein